MKITKSQIKKDEKFLKPFIKVKEAAKILGVCRDTVYNRVKAGKLDNVTAFKGTDAEEAFFYRHQVEALASNEKEKN